MIFFSQVRPSSTFLFIQKYKNSFDEVSDISIVFHINYFNCLKRSVEVVNNFEPIGKIQKQAKDEVKKSLLKSIENYSENDKDDSAYFRVKDAENNFIKGVKIHKYTNDLHIFGLLNKKTIIIPGKYKEVKSSELTLAKNHIKSFAPISKFRQFKLNDNFEKISVEHFSIS